MPRNLVAYEDYTHGEVHDLFAPQTKFTPQTGTWGLHGTVSIPNRPKDYVFFVTYEQKQGEHQFDEGVSADGVLTWQSQPKQRISERSRRDAESRRLGLAGELLVLRHEEEYLRREGAPI